MNKSTINKTKNVNEIAQILVDNFFISDLAYMIANYMDEAKLKEILEDEGLDTSFLASTKKSKNVKKSVSSDLADFGGRIIVSRGGGDAGKEWDFLDYTMELEDNGDESALDDLYEKIDSGKEKFTLHRNNGWDYDITVIKSTKKSRVKKDIGNDFDYEDYAQNKAPMILNRLRDAVSVLPSYLTATSIEYGLMIGEYYIDIESGKNLESRDNFNEVCQVLSSAISMYVEYFEVFFDYDDDHHIAVSLRDTSVPGGDSLYASTKKSKMKKTGDLPRAGDVYTNDYGGSCKIISVDEPSLSNEYQLDNFQIAYQMGDSYPVCHKWKDVKAMLELNGYNYQASTKKSYTPNYQDFRSMVGSIRNTGNHNKVFKE